jgi:RND superfamily putative drug exporter
MTRSRFARLGGWALRHRYAALLGWVLALVVLIAGSQAVGPDWRNDFTLPGTETERVQELLDAHAPDRAGDELQVVLASSGKLDGTRVSRVLDAVRDAPSVATVDELTRSADGTVGLATVTLDGRATDVPVDDVRRIIDVAQGFAGDGLRVEVGGDPVREADEGDGGGAAEGAGILAALVILVLLFGSLLAASLPIVIAIFAVGAATGLVTLASHVATIADFTVATMALVGLGVGIDYALLVFSRFRAELLGGLTREDAVIRALDTAGRTILFAGCTVIVALLGLVLLGLGSLQGVAVAIALTVLTTMVAALTLLPALLGLFGPRIERRLRRRATRRTGEGERWRRWSGLVQARPWPFALGATALLLVLAVPALDMRLGFADAGTDAPSSTSRQAYDLVADAFGPGASGPLVVVNEGDPASDAALARMLAAEDGVARVTPPVRSPDGAIATALAFPEATPQSPRTSALVERLRADVPDGVAIGGATAAAVDFSDAVADRLLLFVGAVVLVSALLLLVVFRSVWIPVKAAVLNLLSVGAALGVLTWVFGEGHLGAQPGPVEAFIPVFTFAIVFGLSMDYEVFLLSRMHEAWERRRDAPAAIAEGLATTGRVVTAAAAIMVLVFGSFLLSPSRMLQQMGLGMAVAVLLDAVVVRCLLLPAVMQLLGERAWWLPRRLARRLPRVALESGS